MILGKVPTCFILFLSYKNVLQSSSCINNRLLSWPKYCLESIRLHAYSCYSRIIMCSLHHPYDKVVRIQYLMLIVKDEAKRLEFSIVINN